MLPHCKEAVFASHMSEGWRLLQVIRPRKNHVIVLRVLERQRWCIQKFLWAMVGLQLPSTEGWLWGCGNRYLVDSQRIDFSVVAVTTFACGSITFLWQQWGGDAVTQLQFVLLMLWQAEPASQAEWWRAFCCENKPGSEWNYKLLLCLSPK